MEKAERARQGQERLVEFQQQAIERLDSNRGSILGATVGLQSLFADGEMAPNELLRELLLHELSLQFRLTVSGMERRYRVLSEEIRRLRRIEDGQREAQGMNDREVVELLGRYGEVERDRLMVEPSEEAWNRCPTDCIIL
jgi:ferredoxin